MSILRNFLLTFSLLSSLSISAKASDINIAKLQVQQDEKLTGVLKRLATARSNQQSTLSQLNLKLREVKFQEQGLVKELVVAKQQLETEQAELRKQREASTLSEQDSQRLDREVLSEALSDIGVRYPWWQKETFGELLRRTQVELSHSDSTTWQKNTQQLKVLTEYAKQLSDRFEIKNQQVSLAIPSLDGHHSQGQLTVVGSWSYFYSKSDDVLGVVQRPPNHSSSTHPPKFHRLPTESEQSLLTWLNGKSNMLPVDLSEGNVFDKNKSEKQSWKAHLRKGGLWVLPILGFALLATLISLIKLWQLFRIRQPSQQTILSIAQAIEQNKRDEAERLISELTPLWQTMMRVSLDINTSMEWIEESMMEHIMLAEPRLQRGLTIIAVTATTAPLLGLLGTVTGIIKTFKAMENGGAETQALVQGISEALITTKLGLVLAIPALVIHALLSRRAHALLANMERSSIAMVNVLSRSNDRFSDAGEVKKNT